MTFVGPLRQPHTLPRGFDWRSPSMRSSDVTM